MADTGMLNPYYMPSHKSESVVDLDTLVGGLNLYEQPYRLGVNETPDVLNLLWRDGALGGRDAQAWLCSIPHGVGYACFDGRYHDHEFYHIGDTIYATRGVPETKTVTFSTAGTHTIEPLGFTHITSASDPDVTWDGNTVSLPRDGSVTVEYLAVPLIPVCLIPSLYPGCTLSRGVFLRYQDDLIYKADGLFIRIFYRDGVFGASDILTEAYTPITLINADAATGTGDLYQPENRLSAKKTVWYEAGTVTKELTGVIPAGSTEIPISDAGTVGISDVYIGGTIQSEGIDFQYDRQAQKIIGLVSSDAERTYRIIAEVPTTMYRLPVGGVEDVSVEARMTADGGITPLVRSTAALMAEPTAWDSSWDGDFVFWPETGVVLFKAPPYVALPKVSNTVRITYTKPNPVALEAVMSCKYAMVYGGDTNLCFVLGGSSGQPNVIFWNGNNVSMDITYFPMTSYNLAGDNSEAVTGFGRQQNLLIIFKERSLSKAILDTQTIDERLYLSLNVIDINSRIGCDLPQTIQLIDNNLVFCNTYGGLHVLLDTSAANENNIRGISKKVNGTPARDGILRKVRRAGSDRCVSYDDDARYWLVIDGEVYVWDYVLSDYKNPSFFYLENIHASAFCRGENELHYLTPDGRLVAMGSFTESDNPFSDLSYTDFGEPIPKRYATPVMFFSDGDRLKDINSVIFTVASDTWSRLHVTYTTDCETRRDQTEALYLFYRFLPRNLGARSLAPKTYSATIRRKPGCRHVRYFSMLIESTEKGTDMNLVSIQIYYRKQGRDR